METITQDRDRAAEWLQDEADRAAKALVKLQRATAAQLNDGAILDWSCLESLAKAQADAHIWATATQVCAFWADRPDKAPERADIVEAAHEVRADIIREAISYRGGVSSSGMTNELERAKQVARRDFLDRTAMIYPQDSPLRRLGR